MRILHHLSLGLALCFVQQTFAAFAGGSGTSADPYQITTVDQLQSIKSDLVSHYVLTQDIDASATATWNGSTGFSPIGPSFSGTLDGQGHTISGLVIKHASSVASNGLFGSTTATSVISNLKLTGVSIAGGSQTGAIAGSNLGLIYNVSVQGSVTGTAYTGGVVGLADRKSRMWNAQANVTVVGTSSVGGLVGRNTSGSIFRCFVQGSVSGTLNVGGVVGDENMINSETPLFKFCGTRANVTGDSAVGGFAGYLLGDYKGSYAAGSVTARIGKGGFGGVASGSSVGGQACYFDKTVAGVDSTARSICSPQTSANMLMQSTYADSIWQFGAIWNMAPAVNGGYPDNSNLFSGAGAGTVANPYQISNLQQLQEMATNPWASYVITQDIHASATKAWNGGQGFRPVDLLGNLDGQNHVIDSLYINRPTKTGVGLLGSATVGQLQNLTIDSATIIGLQDVGIFGGTLVIGNTVGRIDSVPLAVGNLSASGMVQGNHYTGGFAGSYGSGVGAPHGNFKFSGTVKGSSTVGGMFGQASDNFLHNVTVKATVLGDSNVGGVFGTSTSEHISHVNFAGYVKGGSMVGGLAGYSYSDFDSVTVIADSVIGHFRIGGALGYGTQGSLSHSYIEATVTVSGEQGGGVAGSSQGTHIVNCVAKVNVVGSGAPNVGGVTGFSSSQVGIDSVKVTGSVTGYSNVGGLVGDVQSWGTHFKDDTLDVTVKGSQMVGGIFGLQYYGISERCFVKGSVTGLTYVGGVVGYAQDTVLNSRSEATIKGSQYVGGLVGYNKMGNILWSSATGDVTGDQMVGGLVGENDSTIRTSFATGKVVANMDRGGGLVGVSEANTTIENCYSKGSAFAGTIVGGLVGSGGGGVITNSYTTTAVTMGASGYWINGFVGDTMTPQGGTGPHSVITHCFFDAARTLATTDSMATSISAANLHSATFLSGNGWNFDNFWAIDPQQNDGDPILVYKNIPVVPPVSISQNSRIEKPQQEIKISAQEINANGLIRVYDMRGTLATQGFESIHLGTLPHGLYVVKATGSRTIFAH